MMISSGGGLRFYTIDGHDVDDIIFYGNGEIYATAGHGWLDHHVFSDDKSRSYSADVVSIDIDRPVVAKKENLNRTDNYVLSTRKRCHRTSEKSHYILYIYLIEKPVDLGEFLNYETPTHKSFDSFISFPMVGIDYSKNELTEIIMVTGCRHENTDLGNRIDCLVKEFKELDIRIHSYDIEKILKHYDLVKKS